MIDYLRRKKLQWTVLYRCILSDVQNVRLLKKGQNLSFRILMLSHRLEKGLCISNPRDMWGWDKANELVKLVSLSNDTFAIDTAKAVLRKYLDVKLGSRQKDIQMARSFEESNAEILHDAKTNLGGFAVIKKTDLEFNIGEIEKLFYNRHCVRDFDDTEIQDSLIVRAVELANRCPSACNRQPFACYVISDSVWQVFNKDSNQVYNANKHLLITGVKNAFSVDEIDDWIVSSSIFAGYLSLTLPLYGIGCCVIRKGIVEDGPYAQMKERCGIPANEKVILELVIGNLKDEFKVPVSNRKDIDSFLHFVKE